MPDDTTARVEQRLEDLAGLRQLLAGGDVLRAASRWNKAYRKVAGLQP